MCFAEIPPGCEVSTTTGYRYSNFYRLTSNEAGESRLGFRVMAQRDAHIVLTTSVLGLNPLYEIVIGASGNNYTDLRRTLTGRSVSAVKTPSVLSDTEFRGFWIHVVNGEIEIGREGETLPYFHWKDIDPIPVEYYSFSSWVNSAAKWIHGCNVGGSSPWLSSEDAIGKSVAEVPILTPESDEGYYNVMGKLRSNLLQTYSRDIRPGAYHRYPISVAVHMSLTHLDLNEAASRFIIHCWYTMSWRDDRLQWNVSEYEGLNVLHVPSYIVWQPDIVLINNADVSGIPHFSERPVQVYPDGSVIWVPQTSFEAMCQLDLRFWPYDTQTCALRIGSWAHNGNFIDVTLKNNDSAVGIIEHIYISNLQWELLNANATITTQYYQNGPDQPYPESVYTFVIRRRSPMFGATIIAPAIMIILMTLATFLLSPNTTEKILIGVVDLLILSFYLIYFSIIIPRLGDHMPFIAMFYSYTFIMVAMSVMLAIATTVLVRTPSIKGPPSWIYDQLLGFPGTLLGLNHLIITIRNERCPNQSLEVSGTDYSPQVNTDIDTHNLVPPQQQKSSTFDFKRMNNAEIEWLLLAYALDRLGLVIYCFIFTIMMAIYL